MTRGFTLLEVVVVLAVLGLATALVAPAGMRAIASWQRMTQAEEVLGAMAALSASARARGEGIVIDAGTHESNEWLPLPEGWAIDFDEALVVRSSGACSQARGTLFVDEAPIAFRLEAPYCRVRLGEE